MNGIAVRKVLLSFDTDFLVMCIRAVNSHSTETLVAGF